MGDSLGRSAAALRWFFRKWFWILLAWFKAAVNKPLVIPIPEVSGGAGGLITPVPLAHAVGGLPIENVRACSPDQIPRDERSRSKTLFYKLQVWLYSHYPPMQAGLPSISTDPDRALKHAYTWLHRRIIGEPALPAEFMLSPDLGALAVRGPYACYTRSSADGTPGAFEWDLMELSGYEHHPGLRPLGARVFFELLPAQRKLRARRIVCSIGSIGVGEPGWELAKRLALCSATTHLSLVRHFNWVHLAAGAHIAIATRNRLPVSHPLLRLLWPFIFGTQQSNDTVTRGQMLPGGDFECTFSLTFEGLCRLYDDTYGALDFAMNDPVIDARTRGVVDQGFDTQTEDNLAALFFVMLEHARHYLGLYYPHAADRDGDTGLRDDAAILAWLDELNRLVPNGVGVTSADVRFESLARLMARILYLASAQHELVGSFLWNYQLWTHRQPVRVYASGQPEPVDIYQRLVNANYNLNVHRRALLDDFSYLALDDVGAAAMRRFTQQMQALQAAMEQEPWAAWKLYPRVLKVNINA
jgi:arachidonate 15-lipoxygenase